MVTIIINLYSISIISYNSALNLKIINDKLIIKHLDNQFIINLRISYNDYIQNYISKEYTNDKLIDRLMLHSYNDRLVKKEINRHIKNAIFFDFVESNLKSVKDYMKAFQIVNDQ